MELFKRYWTQSTLKGILGILAAVGLYQPSVEEVDLITNIFNNTGQLAIGVYGFVNILRDEKAERGE